MNERHAILINEIRYAERLTARTARLYRHAATGMTFLTVLGGSGVLSSFSSIVPNWVSLVGASILALAGAAALAVRPVEKAVANEAEARKYAALRTAGVGMNAEQLETALQKARESDIPEVESLREVAYNDLLDEIGRGDLKVELHPTQRLLSTFA